MSNKDALMFPLIASCALFGLYVFFQIFSKEYINLLLTGYFFFLGHWIANNLFGIAFAINGVELLHLNNVVTGCILLCGLFLYDVFWVFGTNVMIMHVFKHAQPALLYLVPACLGTPLALALLRGDINALFNYEDQPAVAEEPSKSKKTE
ncbi:hypothetical protein MSG28_008419 [Choristoneura fumiferana]|uniref:Uncharacterized protein n=1 Tax=Choristoneura fumiferana TaxID=7141 RepID=A0ACC0J5E6_CHOFU|nr:hypothetical protein MSG28_008419 [Choristoneura fumiferana]